MKEGGGFMFMGIVRIARSMYGVATWFRSFAVCLTALGRLRSNINSE
jgi:hypothetical protein